MGSILTDVKQLLGIESEYTHFDTELILNINSVFMILQQLGIGPEEGFSISDNTAVWSDFIGDKTDVEAIKTYTFMKVKLIFDPPQGSYLVEAIKSTCTELEWRLNTQAERMVIIDAEPVE